MITLFDMETGEIIEHNALPIAPSGAVSATSQHASVQPQLALQTMESSQPVRSIPVVAAQFDITEILAKFSS